MNIAEIPLIVLYVWKDVTLLMLEFPWGAGGIKTCYSGEDGNIPSNMGLTHVMRGNW